MIRIGKEPYLECSSRGDKRFSAFYARLKKYGNKSIEVIYQSAKIFPDGSKGLNAKGKKALNMDYCAKLYSELWDLYFEENPELLEVIKKYNGFSDIFGRPGCQCQALEIYRIKNKNK